jgi:hypothetical protein
MIRNNKKRGEMTTEQIVLLIVLIVSFAVILFFLFRLNLGKTTDQETCHNSVVTRSSNVIPKASIPLNCKTQYICISKDGICESMNHAQIEKVKNKDEVYSVLANQMADCWWMFGEGKLDYVGGEIQPQLYCSICSQIAFDASLSSIFADGEIDRRDFYNYLESTNASGKGASYLKYLVGDNYLAWKQSLKDSSQNFGKININKQHYIVMGELSKLDPTQWGVVGAGGFAGVVVLLSIGAIVTGGAAIPAYIVVLGAGAGGATGYFAGTIFQGESGKNYFSPTIVEANSEDFESLRCKDINTLG